MLCQISVMSRRLFTDTFKAITGLTVVDFINTYRIGKARYYILFSDKSLSEIAELSGFYDKAHLSRTFKKLYGISTTEFRKENQRNALILDKERTNRWKWIQDEKKA